MREQLGDIVIQRGPLVREGLQLQTLILGNQAERLAWLVDTIPELAGTGIVYVLTKRDAEQVSRWLTQNNIQARAYYSDAEDKEFPGSNSYRQHLEDMLLNNELKVLVATNALGMGYNKPDLGFVIHYQAPGFIVAYYQQVGRAGRGISSSTGVLLSGLEDRDIHVYSRESAFPSESDIFAIPGALERYDGLTNRQLEEHTNVRFHQCQNLDGVFVIQSDLNDMGPVLLVDDVVDSGWTFTVIAALLQDAGSGKVYPVALASTTTGD